MNFRNGSGKKESKFKLDYGTAPLIGVIILLLTLTIDFNTIIKGIIGSEVVHPYSIIILFMAMAYVCISIDLTGFFKYLAIKVAKSAGSSGRKLFIYFFFFSSILTVFTSNDIVILTITPIIIYMARYIKTNPIPYLIGQFFAANIWSLTLYIGNPTNIIVAEAYGLTFLEYSLWSILPTIVAGISCMILLMIVFRKKVPREINLEDLDLDYKIEDRYGAIFSITCLIACLIIFSLSSVISIQLWQVALFFAVILFTRNIIHDIRNSGDNEYQPRILKNSMMRMPWKIMTFIIGMFILIESLILTGWINITASLLSFFSQDLFSSIFFMTTFSSLMCCVMNNQPMTIFFTQALLSDALSVDETIRFALMFSLIIGSNFGANLALTGALAGIMWQKISKEKDVVISFKEFTKYGLLVMPLVILLTCLTLYFEILIWL